MSTNRDGKKLTALLGTVINLNVVNGVVEEIQMTKAVKDYSDENTVSLTLPMLISYITGKDDQYLVSLKCLDNDLKEQADILEIRQAELINLPAAASIRQAQETLDKMYSEYQSDSSFSAKLTRSAFDRTYLPILAEKYPGAVYLLKKGNFLLGENLTLEKEFNLNMERLETLKIVRPLVAMKLKGAQLANAKMKKLTTQQLKQLIGFMITLRGSDVPVASDIVALRSSLATRAMVNIEADLIQYQELSESVADLAMFLTSPVAL